MNQSFEHRNIRKETSYHKVMELKAGDISMMIILGHPTASFKPRNTFTVEKTKDKQD